jgi:hypothetical protein
MKQEDVNICLKKINEEDDPTLRALGVSKLLSDLFAEKNKKLVVVGGSAIELLTEGKYASSDIDICFEGGRPQLRELGEIMGKLGAIGGTRSFTIPNSNPEKTIYLDILGEVETLSSAPFRLINGVAIAKPEDLIAERVLMSIYPQKNEDAKICAKKLIAVAINGTIDINWEETERVAALPEYNVARELKKIKEEVSKEVKNKGQRKSLGPDIS